MLKRTTFLLLFSIYIFQLFPDPLRVIYPNVNGGGSELFGYAALKLALDKSGMEYNLQLSSSDFNNQRIRYHIEKGDISVSDFGTSIEYEEELLPVYFPIDLGLNGWRIFLVNKNNINLFNNINTLDELKTKIAVQGLGWADTDILLDSGIKVKTAPTLNHLIKMINNGRYDYLPLGANEVYSLKNLYKQDSPNIVVEESIVLIYPFARLFFVNKNNTELRDIIYNGLIKSFSDGSFIELFRNHPSNRELFYLVNLENRIQINIDNRFTTDNFKKIPKEYFYTPDMFEKY